MSGNQPTKLKKTIKEMEEELMAQQQSQMAHAQQASPFARGSEIAYKRTLSASPYYHQATPEELARIQEQQRPQPRASSPPRTTGLTSATLARERAYENARQKQVEYYAMLEQRYGAIRGDDRSYLAAMERYNHDVEVERKKKKPNNKNQNLNVFAPKKNYFEDNKLKENSKNRENALDTKKKFVNITEECKNNNSIINNSDNSNNINNRNMHQPQHQPKHQHPNAHVQIVQNRF